MKGLKSTLSTVATADIHDMEGVQAMLDSPPAEVAAQMESHGVLPPIAAYIEK